MKQYINVNATASTAEAVSLFSFVASRQQLISGTGYNFTVSGFYPYIWWAQLTPSEK